MPISLGAYSCFHCKSPMASRLCSSCSYYWGLLQGQTAGANALKGSKVAGLTYLSTFVKGFPIATSNEWILEDFTRQRAVLKCT